VQKKGKIPSFINALVASSVLTTSLISQSIFNQPAQAAMEAYCRLSQEEVLTKEKLLHASLGRTLRLINNTNLL